MAYPGGIGSRNPSKQTLDRTGKLPARSLERLNHPSFVLSPLTEKRRGNYDVMDVWYSIEIIRRYLTRNFSLTRESCISSSCVFNHEGRRRNLSYFLKENAKHSNYREYMWYVYLASREFWEKRRANPRFDRTFAIDESFVQHSYGRKRYKTRQGDGIVRA